MNHWAIDIQMEYLQEHWLMPADYPEHHWVVSKLCQLLSTSHRISFARESLLIWSPPWTVSLPQMYPFAVEEHCDLPRPLVEEHCGLQRPWEAGAPVQRQTRMICRWLPIGIWAMVVLWPRLDVVDLEVECGQSLYWHSADSLAAEPL